jgi:aerotaxis receptor
VYGEVLVAEEEAARRGATRREVAGLGAVELAEALARRGFSSYEEFLHRTLPHEIAARTNLVTTVYARPTATGQIAEVLGGTRAVDHVLEDLVGRLATYEELGDELAAAAVQVVDMVHRLEGSVGAAQEASALVATKTPVLGNVARVLATPMAEAVTALDGLADDFVRLRADIERLRYQISLARLYNDMAAAFAAEVHDGDAPPDSLDAVPLLCDAAETCVVDMAAQVQHVNADLHEAAGLVKQATGLLGDFRRFLGQWRQLVLRHARTTIGDTDQPIHAEIYASWTWTDQLRDLGRQAGRAVVPFDPAQLRAPLAAMRPRRTA